jgi:hypothetical protein
MLSLLQINASYAKRAGTLGKATQSVATAKVEDRLALAARRG